jgi:hypothetical protein
VHLQLLKIASHFFERSEKAATHLFLESTIAIELYKARKINRNVIKAIDIPTKMN